MLLGLCVRFLRRCYISQSKPSLPDRPLHHFFRQAFRSRAILSNCLFQLYSVSLTSKASRSRCHVFLSRPLFLFPHRSQVKDCRVCNVVDWLAESVANPSLASLSDLLLHWHKYTVTKYSMNIFFNTSLLRCAQLREQSETVLSK